MNKIFMSGLLLFCTACSGIPQPPAGFEEKEIETEHFRIAVWEKEDIQKNGILRLYIEGDGTPNPKEAMALKLAAKDPYPNVIVMARPCQYVNDEICTNSAIWEAERYHPEIMAEMEELTQFLIRKHKAKGIEFVAYDGGAPVAFNLAARVGGTRRIITVAGILDIDANSFKNNNINTETAENAVRQKKSVIAQIPQIHYVGDKDTIATRRMAERFVSRLKNPRSAVVKVAPDTGHFDWDDVELDY